MDSKTPWIQVGSAVLMLICVIISIHDNEAFLAALNGASCALLTVSAILSFKRLNKGKNNGG